MTEDKLKAAGMIKCDTCSRWMYRDESTPCPFCALPEPCITCDGPADTDSPATVGFIPAEGPMVLMCGECCLTVAAIVFDREAAR